MRGPYQLEIEGERFSPSSFGPLRNMRGEEIYNPDWLFADAKQAAQRLAAELEQPVEVIGRLGRGGAEEVRAARYAPRREGDYVYVPIGGRSFNEWRCLRPLASAPEAEAAEAMVPQARTQEARDRLLREAAKRWARA